MRGNKAVLIAICDVSGSMGRTKKMVAKEYLGFVRATLKSIYEEVTDKYIAHTIDAYDRQTEEELFNKSEKGGTYLSSAYDNVLNTIKSTNRNESDVYVIHFSDGDNWAEDNDRMVEKVKETSEISDFVQFVEIKNSTYSSTVFSRLQEVINSAFSMIKVKTADDILEMFKSTRNTLKTLKPKISESRARDLKRRYNNKEVGSIERYGNTTVVTLKDGTVGTSKCYYKDTYDEEIGFTVAHLRARIESDTKRLNEIVKPVIYVEVLDGDCCYDTYEELGRKYETDILKFEECFTPLTGQHLELIEYTKHRFGYNVAICKDSCNRIIIMDKNAVKEIK